MSKISKNKVKKQVKVENKKQDLILVLNPVLLKCNSKFLNIESYYISSAIVENLECELDINHKGKHKAKNAFGYYIKWS